MKFVIGMSKGFNEISLTKKKKTKTVSNTFGVLFNQKKI